MTTKPPAMTEDQLLRAVTDALTLTGWRWQHPRRSDKALVMGHQGFPDLICVRPPRFLIVELKTQTGKVSQVQEEWLADLSQVGLRVFVLRPDGLDDFLEEIQQ